MTDTTEFPASRSTEPQRALKPIAETLIPPAVFDEIPDEHRRDLYILITDGDCLEPETRHGDHALVAPGMPIRRGDFVALWPKNPEHRPSMKRVVIAPPDDWVEWSPAGECVPLIIVEQLNPPRGSTRSPPTSWRRCTAFS